MGPKDPSLGLERVLEQPPICWELSKVAQRVLVLRALSFLKVFFFNFMKYSNNFSLSFSPDI
jgi:hypothetical protein